jgi:hypothetical protein
VKTALKGEDTAAIKASVEKLQAASAELYQAAASESSGRRGAQPERRAVRPARLRAAAQRIQRRRTKVRSSTPKWWTRRRVNLQNAKFQK